jgi:6-pyruvoyltetrahydropterin/6-carboxytetrahydropterin synthase
MTYQVTKTYGHDLGLSVAFRQWRAPSHCRFVHGYALAVSLTFESDTLDERNWVIDFGGLDGVKAWLQRTFDHKLLVAVDDPCRDHLLALQVAGLADAVLVASVGCEAFAELVFHEVATWLDSSCDAGRVRLVKVVVSEHGSNSAAYIEAPHAQA